MSNPEIVECGNSNDVGYKWLMKNGEIFSDFPAKEYEMQRKD